MIVDAQLHEPAVWLDWSAEDADTCDRLLTELTLAAIGAVGVDAAVLFPTASSRWAEQAAAAHPETFAVVRVITPDGIHDGLDAGALDIAERIEQETSKPTTVGLRILPASVPARDGSGFAMLRDGYYDRALEACERLGVPLFTTANGDLEAPGEVARRHPGLTVIVDHLGLPQYPPVERDTPPFRQLDGLLALARHPNVAVKLCGLPALAATEYPFADTLPHLLRVLEAFGAGRVMWASDISRFNLRIGFHHTTGTAPYPGRHSYAESLHHLKEATGLTPAERELVLGGTTRRLLGWPAAATPA